MTSAKIIADSISESGIRITTMELEFERFLLAQFNTHRQFSRSAQSSRAVPVQKMIDALNENAFIPKFMKNEKGMQSTEFLESVEKTEARQIWRDALSNMTFQVKRLIALDVHKQFANRLLEPFATVKVVVTATEWENFFALRLHHAAQPEMQELAQSMKNAMDNSVPEMLDSTLWHLPYVSHDEYTGLGTTFLDLALISAARCARVSYLNHDNSTPDIEKDLVLAGRLLADKHLSPFEHQAKPMANKKVNGFEWEKGETHIDNMAQTWSGNFRGWIQHRQLVDL
jgi:thymidylate synthase ThyX